SASDDRSMDFLERPVDEIRTFFGYPRKVQASGVGQNPELADAIRNCFKRQELKKPPAKAPDLAEEIKCMAGDRAYRLRFLVALVPDPRGSYVGSQFDAYAAALLRGATASGWVPDRHWLPWSNNDLADVPTKEASRPSGGRYLRSPGIVLFRSNSADRTLLAVFLVGESPLLGINKRQFTATLQLISSVNPGHALQILGPFSSGAAPSCALAIEEWCKRAEPRASTISLLSGSATNPDVGKQLLPRPGVCGALKVVFRRTVSSDAALREEAFKFFLEGLGWNVNEIALMAETDSPYG